MDPIIIKLIVALFWGVVVGLLAKRKNRNPWGWGLAGALSWLIALIFLMFMPYKCPKCGKSITNDEGKKGICPSCGNFKIMEDETIVESSQTKNQINPSNLQLPFKSNKAAFEYTCKYLDTTLKEGVILPAIVIDSNKEFGTVHAIKVNDDRSQIAMIKVASSDGGFFVPANTDSSTNTQLKPGDFVAWQAMQYRNEVGKLSEDKRFGWIGLIIGTLKPVYENNAWVGNKKL